MRRIEIINSVIRWLKSRALAQIGGVSVFLLSGYGVADATQASVTGTIAYLGDYSSVISTPTMAGVTIFQMSSGLSEGCVWLWVDHSDARFLAMLLSAKATSATVEVMFESAIPAPWGDASTCVAQRIILH